MINNFDDIRPFYDEEVQQAIQRLVKESSFLKILAHFFEQADIPLVVENLGKVNSLAQFRNELIYAVVLKLRKDTTAQLSSHGIKQEALQSPCLIISNHRDIVMDSAFLNLLLHEAGINTVQVAIGNNLLVNDMVTDLAKLNRNFTVRRNVPSRQLYEYSHQLSAYIRHVQNSLGESVWIAQREGRAKDGNDQTQPGLLKMLSIAGADEDVIASLKELKMLPLSISYEYDPCALLKAEELYKKKIDGKYEKKADDDLQSMILGITGFKGRVHYQFCNPLNPLFEQIAVEGKSKNDIIKAITALIDREIHEAYYCWPTNYIAFDKLEGEQKFVDKYDAEDLANFEQHLSTLLIRSTIDDKAAIEQEVLHMYAFPVYNKLKYSANNMKEA